MVSNVDGPRILFVAESIANLTPVLDAISESGYQVLLAFTADQGVAISMSKTVAAVVLDEAFLDVADWPVTKTSKMVRPSLPILLLDGQGRSHSDFTPAEIDSLASNASPGEIAKLRELLDDQSAEAAAG